MSNYDDIIDIKHFEPKHPRMSRMARAAQFASFAALSGFEDTIKETARLTNKRIELTEELINDLNNKINSLLERIKDKPFIEVTYFIPDKYKDGGEYVIKQGNLRVIDLVNQILKFTDNMVIDINEIIFIKIL